MHGRVAATLQPSLCGNVKVLRSTLWLNASSCPSWESDLQAGPCAVPETPSRGCGSLSGISDGELYSNASAYAYASSISGRTGTTMLSTSLQIEWISHKIPNLELPCLYHVTRTSTSLPVASSRVTWAPTTPKSNSNVQDRRTQCIQGRR